MIELLASPAPHVVAFRISGSVDTSDVKTAAAALDRALNLHEQLSLFADLRPLEGISLGRLLRDLRFSFSQLGRFDRYYRVAVVTGEEWIETVATWEGKLIPGAEGEAFATEQHDEALAWIAERPVPARPGIAAVDAEPSESAGGTPILAYALRGPVAAEDVERLEADFAAHERFRLLVRAEDFDGVRPGAFTAELPHMKQEALRRIERYAVVGGPGWLVGLVRAFAPLLPMEVRHLEADEEAEAWAWLREASATSESTTESSAAAPGIEEIPTTSRSTLAFAVTGPLTAADYERTFTPRLKEVARGHDAVDVLLRFDDFDGMTLGALKEDASLVTFVDQLRHIAIVGGPAWMAAASKALAPLLPLDARFFAADDEAEAWAWLDAAPAPIEASFAP
ncbi:MAG: STAS/SEC14 domain-containing protein [Rhodothermales bacterium]